MKLEHQKSKIAGNLFKPLTGSGDQSMYRPRSTPPQINPFWQFFVSFKWLLIALALAAMPAQAATHSKGNVTLFVHGRRLEPRRPHADTCKYSRLLGLLGRI